MSELRLSRSKGLTFKEVVIDNTNGVFLMKVDKPATPNMETYDISAPGKDGSKRQKNRYENRKITVTIGVYNEDIEERRKVQRRITRGLLLSEGRLFFHDEPTLFYIGEVFDEITVEEGDFLTELMVVFECEPFIYEDSKSSTWAGITNTVTKKIQNLGNFEANPIVKIEGTGDRVSVVIEDRAFALTQVKGATYVDTENMNVYTYDGAVKKSVLMNFTGLFPKIPQGDVDVVISGTNFNVSVTISYNHTYIC